MAVLGCRSLVLVNNNNNNVQVGHTYYTIIITYLFTGDPPTITTQPTSQLTTDKTSTILTCEGTGAGTITYHWETSSINEGEWMKISNNNSTKLVANLEQSQQYRCTVSNQFGTTISNVAIINVLSKFVSNNY